MEFKLALLAVKDVGVSKQFYAELFDQKVALDLGWNVTFIVCRDAPPALLFRSACRPMKSWIKTAL
ncbi:hypothetical protein SAMN05660649_00609 [Desulfotomaculum arcticum]|uniref:Glyoxalase-like domain-containing protein n=1 Tax=Desulfotruncus arcticus DSM 17038 TaxID=1121424 RepID=A0A1I2P3Y9_9FIRM|nr:hypothetical protein SAMN05660649_00609 [Desulfotomaculum arcticum] [Desulfotruncus arcticus DSM 17038]